MNLSTDTVISKFLPRKFLSNITKADYPSINLNYITFNTRLYGKVPLYALYTYQDAAIFSLRYSTVAYKSLGKRFIDCFRDLAYLKSFIVNDNNYKVGKGIILDNDNVPLILTTYDISDGTLGTSASLLDQSRIQIYISRKIYDMEFKISNPKIYREIMNNIIPNLMQLDIPIVIKKDINMFSSIYIDPNLKFDELQQIFKNNIPAIQEIANSDY